MSTNHETMKTIQISKKIPTMKTILKPVSVVYIDGNEDYFEAAQIRDTGVHAGRFIDGEFIRYSFIPKQCIKALRTSQ